MEVMLMVMSRAAMKMKAVRKVNGIPTAASSAPRNPTSSQRATTTRMPPSRALFSRMTSLLATIFDESTRKR